jgi:hypothetical protein
MSQLRLTVLNKIILISTCQKFARLTFVCYLLQVRAIYMYINKPRNLKGETMYFFETSENVCLKTCRKTQRTRIFNNIA